MSIGCDYDFSSNSESDCLSWTEFTTTEIECTASFHVVDAYFVVWKHGLQEMKA